MRSARSAWASTPSTSSPVAGSSPSWPEQNTMSPLRIAWLYGPIAAGAPPVEIACRVIDRSSPRWSVRIVVSPRRTAARRPGMRASASAAAARTRRRRGLRRRRAKDRAPRASGRSPTARSAGPGAGSAPDGAARGRARPPRRPAADRSPRRGRRPARGTRGRVSPEPNSLAKCSDVRRATPGSRHRARRPRRRTPRRCGPAPPASRAGRPAARLARRGAVTPWSGVTRSPRPSTRAGAAARGRTGRRCRGRAAMRESLRRGSSSAPHASSAPPRAAAASLDPPASPAATGIRFSRRTASGGAGRRRHARDGRAGGRDRPEHEVVGGGPGIEARDVERVVAVGRGPRRSGGRPGRAGP